VSLAPAAATPDPGPRHGQDRADREGVRGCRKCSQEHHRGKKLRLASLGHTLVMGLSSRIQAGAVTGPPYLANFRQRLCPAARASLRAMLALLLQTLASIITKRWIGSVETGLRTGFRPRTSRVTFERAKRRLPTNEASRLEACCPARLIASRSSPHIIILCAASVAPRF
jgi:hypothetical protein